MHKVTAREAKNRLGEVFTKAKEEPVVITRNGVPAYVVMGYDDYMDGHEQKRDSRAAWESIKGIWADHPTVEDEIAELRKQANARIDAIQDRK